MSVSAHIAAQRTDHGVPHAVSCRALGVAASTFYKWHNRPPTPAQRRRADLDVEVRACFNASGGTYGSPRVRAELRRSGRKVSKKTVESSMARQGLQGRARRRRRGLTRPDKRAEPVPDLLRRDFTAGGANEKWVGGLQADRHRRGAGVPRHRGGPVLQAHAGLRAVRPPPHRGAGHRRPQHGRRGARRRRRRGDLPHRQGLSGRIQSVVATPRDGGGRLWVLASVSRRFVRCGARCGRRGGPRRRGARIGSGSGRRSRGGCRARTRPVSRGCRRRWGRGGSDRLGGCRRSVWLRCRSGI